MNAGSPRPPVEAASFADVDRRLAWTFGGLILALMGVALLAGGLYIQRVMDREEGKLSTLLTQVLANSVSRVSFSGKYHARLLLEEIKVAQPGIRYLRLSDLSGRVFAHSDPEENDSMLDAPSLEIVRAVLRSDSTHVRTLTLAGEPVREITLPYRGGYDNQVLGVIQVGLSEREREQALRQGIGFMALLVALLLVIGILAVHRLSRRFGEPVRALAADLAATLQAVPDLLFELDREGRHLQVLGHRKSLLVLAADKLLGRTVAEVMPEAAAESVMQALAEAERTGESHGRVIALDLAKDRHYFELSVARKQSVQ